jgi:hypothetical protein
MISCARPPLIIAADHQRGTPPLHRRACILLSPAPHFAPPPFSRLPFRNRSLRPASRHTFSSLTILSTPNPSNQAVRPHSFQSLTSLHSNSSHTDFSVSQLPLVQNIVQASWPHFVLLLPIAFNPFAVSSLRVLSNLLPKHYPLSHPPELPPRLAVGLPRVTLRTPPRLISPNFTC